ncbi:hypothetical protein HDV06_005987 [Boothiomyces sp. JEL0866]|nr:hypothetical protein HDV06_005987 [Boothiomyces sp. JEL0866]
MKPSFKDARNFANLYFADFITVDFVIDSLKLESQRFVCNIVLLGENDTYEHTLYGSKAALRKLRENIIGNTTSESLVFTDPEDGQPKIFFVFSNLYIKVPGKYRFLCQLVDFTHENIQLKELKTSTFEIQKLREFQLDYQPSVLTKSFEIQDYANKRKYK